jgi:hypothetical protein
VNEDGENTTDPAHPPAVRAAWPQQDLRDLSRAVRILERPSLPIELSNLLGMPIDYLIDRLPSGASQTIHAASRRALTRAMETAVNSLQPGDPPSLNAHRGFAAISGGVGGLFGLPALMVELPISTIIMLRAIAAVAQGQGEKLDQLEPRLSCLNVFALASRARGDDDAESSYFVMRTGLALMVSEATTQLTTRGLNGHAINPLVRLMAVISRRFGVAVTEKVAAQTVPLVGGVGGASVNLLFTAHFQRVALGHFTVRRLERKHGRESVEAAYDQMRDQLHHHHAHQGAGQSAEAG